MINEMDDLEANPRWTSHSQGLHIQMDRWAGLHDRGNLRSFHNQFVNLSDRLIDSW
jgi:hypothetical protein